MTITTKKFKDLFLPDDITIFKLLKLLLNKLQIFEEICWLQYECSFINTP